jgi:hypothetical protein
VLAHHNYAALDWLGRLRLLTASQLRQLAWPSLAPRAARARLHRLTQAGLVRCTRTHSGDVRGLYYLSSAGAAAIAALWGEDAPALSPAAADAAADSVHLRHRLALADVVVSLAQAGRDVEVVPAHRLRYSWDGQQVTPDAVIHLPAVRLAGQPAGAWLVLEFDSGLRSLEAIRDQIARYRDASTDSQAPSWLRALGHGAALVVYVTERGAPSRGAAILRMAREAWPGDALVQVLAVDDLVGRVAQLVGGGA